ncbi:MAG TPA: endonuclease/exonuclease/phosphatase family protein [Candidatus Saccharimonadales bacterium]|nr:endonuclease/exonuclease/phosphatase family protein [Candidatus Saccharimonadales bacterium]
MKLLQLNIWQGRLLDTLVPYLEDEHPDFLCLNEVFSSQLQRQPFGMYGSLERIRAALPGHQYYFAPTFGFEVLGEQVQYGNAVLSRLPIATADTVFLTGAYTMLQNARSITSGRNMQLVTVQVDGRTLIIGNMHCSWSNNPNTGPTATELQKVAAKVQDIQGPLILAGDCNASYDDEAMIPVQRVLYDLSGEKHVKTTFSPLSPVADPLPYNHILVSDHITAHRFKVEENLLISGHLPLVLEFDI